MTDSTQTSQPPAPGGANPRRRFFWSAATATVAAALVAGLGTRAFATGGGHCGWQRGGFMGAMADPATLDSRLDRMLQHLYIEIGATDAQKQQLAPIVKGAMQDLLPLRTQLHDGRRQAVELLSQPTVDRAALEALRANQLKLAEQGSQRLTRASGGGAAVLTTEQKKRLAEHAGRWQRHHG